MDQANRAKKETALRAEAKDRKRERGREETGPANINMSRREEQGSERSIQLAFCNSLSADA
jgi:hypothetical protein